MTAKKATPTTKKAPVKAPVKTNPEPPEELQIKTTEKAAEKLEKVIIPIEPEKAPKIFPEGIQIDNPPGYATKTVHGISHFTCLKCGVLFMHADREGMIQAHARACKG